MDGRCLKCLSIFLRLLRTAIYLMLCCTSETVNLKVEEVKGLMLPFTLTSHWKKGLIQFRYKGRCEMIKRQEVTCIVDTGLPTTYNKWNA